MKKSALLLLAITIALSIAACGKSNANSTPNKNHDPAQSNLPIMTAEEIGGEITISYYDTLSYEFYLEAAARAFEDKYPNVKVNISPFSVMPETKGTVSENGSITELDKDAVAISDYINRTNTELMSGKGADILAMDILPYYKYAESGQIEDLNNYITSDKTFNKADYCYNIMDAMKYKGGQYIFPIYYSFEYMSIIKSSLIEKDLTELNIADKFSYAELVNIGLDSFKSNNENSETPVRMFDSYKAHKDKDVFIELFQQDYNKFIDIEKGKANFQDGHFEDLLETAKAYMDNGYFIPKETVFDDSQKCLFRKQLYFSLYYDITEEDGLAKMLANDAGNVMFDCEQGYAINTNSQNKKTAWEFIKFMAGEELQSENQNLLGNYPINNNANREKAKIDSMASSITIDENGTEIIFSEDEKTIECYNHYFVKLNHYINMLNSYLIQDSIINQMVSKEVDYYFDGTKSALEAADALQSKVELYLNE